MVVPPVDHDCVLKDLVEDLANRLAKLEHENAQLKKAVLGSRSEKSKMPRIKTGDPATPEERQKTRRERAATKAQAPTVRVEHKVPDAERRCTVCVFRPTWALVPPAPGRSVRRTWAGSERSDGVSRRSEATSG
jgi:hypothetical protein